jgi:hypothetical protein
VPPVLGALHPDVDREGTQHMFSRKKIATISWFLGSTAVICVGTTHAYAGGTHGACTRDSQGSVTCTYRSATTYTSGDGTYHVDQKQDCTTVSRDRVEMPESGLGQRGKTLIGPTVDCSNHAPAPRDFKLPGYLR